MNKLEEKVAQYYTKQGYIVYRNGWPDFLLQKNSEFMAVELKGKKDDLKAHQELILSRLTKIMPVRLIKEGVGYGSMNNNSKEDFFELDYTHMQWMREGCPNAKKID